MVKPTINALFLSSLGAEHLPYGYILVAVVAIVASYFYNRGIKRYSLKTLTISTLVVFSLSFLLLSLLMNQGFLNDWVLYVYYLSVALFAVLVTSQFWIIANMVFNAREAKRLFGFIGAGAIAGGIFGGYLTTLLASSFGNKYVILSAAILILFCIPIIQAVWKIRILKLNRYIISQRKLPQRSTESTPLRVILSSKHLTFLAAIVGVGVIMAKLVDFQFSDFANKAIPDSDELASFFGFWFSTFNVIALLIQLFLTNRLLAWLGVTSNLLILPLGIAVGCLVFLTIPELWVLIIIKGMDGSLKQSVNKAGIELSILPIPLNIKNEAKSFIDVVVDSIATGFAGIMLILVVRRLELDTIYITVIILFFLFIWILLIYKLREAYFDSFRRNIQNSIKTDDTVKEKNSDKKTQSAISVLTQGSEAEILVLLSRLEEVRLKTFEPYILKLLDHPSMKIKAAVIKQLYYYKKGTAVNKIRELVSVEDDAVVYNAIEYLLHHTYLDDDSIFKAYLDHPVDYISQAALLSLAKESARNPKLASRFGLNNLIERKIRELSQNDNDLRKEEIAELLLAISYVGEPKYFSFISAHFNNKDPYVINHAIKAAGITLDESFIAPLINFLAEDEFRTEAKRSLQNYGVEIARTILKMDLAESLKPKVKQYVPQVIESFNNKEAYKVIMRLLKSKDVIIRMEAAKSLKVLKNNGLQVKIDQRQLTRIIIKESTFYKETIHAIALLKANMSAPNEIDADNNDALTDLFIAREHLHNMLMVQLEQSLESIFKLLSLKYDNVDIETAYFGLKSELYETKINAVEFLDNLLNARLKMNVLPLIEYHIVDNTEEGISSYEIPSLSEKRIFTKLLKNRGARIKIAVLRIIEYSQNRSYEKVVKSLLKHKNPKVSRAAGFAYQSLQN
ncbi:ATP/ADP translocase-like protein [Constantimarinum furrinae]|uniref:ATP/ADP translocase-like protein n=2 Tax=Constantimarinum furrinae TaxID=2562285 RepID=A0A7G8PRF9_9FLAO|nr:ATP/ADP translocase-like protein [Constantimarinum furrinae]